MEAGSVESVGDYVHITNGTESGTSVAAMMLYDHQNSMNEERQVELKNLQTDTESPILGDYCSSRNTQMTKTRGICDREKNNRCRVDIFKTVKTKSDKTQYFRDKMNTIVRQLSTDCSVQVDRQDRFLDTFSSTESLKRDKSCLSKLFCYKLVIAALVLLLLVGGVCYYIERRSKKVII